MKESTGKEIRALHDILKQHFRALKTAGVTLDAFLTSIVEMIIDTDTRCLG